MICIVPRVQLSAKIPDRPFANTEQRISMHDKNGVLYRGKMHDVQDPRSISNYSIQRQIEGRNMQSNIRAGPSTMRVHENGMNRLREDPRQVVPFKKTEQRITRIEQVPTMHHKNDFVREEKMYNVPVQPPVQERNMQRIEKDAILPVSVPLIKWSLCLRRLRRPSMRV